MTDTSREDELETIRQLLIATANRTENNSESIDAITPKLDQLTERVDGIAVKLDQLTERVDGIAVKLDQLTERVDQTTVNVNNLSATVNQVSTDADADRRVMFGMLEQMDTLHQDNQRILDYLFGRRNGHGNEPQP